MKRGVNVGNNENSVPFSSKVLIFLHFLLGIGAVFGGLVLIIDPSGELIHMPITLLKYSPFDNFLIPGVILLVVLGMLPLIVSYALATKRQSEFADRLNLFHDMHWAWAYSFYISFALIIWITMEIYFIRDIAMIHVAYIFLGLIIQVLTLLPSVQKHYLEFNTKLP
jgi:hypothetical protein